MAQSKIVPVRIPDKLLEFVVGQAEQRGMTVSAYIRFLLEKERER